ncbi:hypothetical protein [Pseudohongiella spirulinae]|uniref:Uncharacterized protein n=1 Tax=Pseudohongiella spirulinae TaxID=1249552 RepID=A0A0S2KBC2_9GAMM|nr:hypothetical protein [Pseudohongiella spirulinae]ALO45295.1 hypothetical protein PS2015_612 [Pseudohongiella spirulinae]
MKSRFIAFLVATALLLPSTLSAQGSIDGFWSFVMNGPFGAVTAEVDLFADGTVLIGQFELSDGQVWPIENGTVNGNSINFDLPRGDSGVVYRMSATIQGDQATGTATAMGTTAEWTMTRSQ